MSHVFLQKASPLRVFSAPRRPVGVPLRRHLVVGPVLPLPANGSDVRNQLVSIYEVLLRREPRSWGYPYSSLNREPRSYGEFPSIWHVGKRKSSVDMTTCRSDCQHSFAISFISTLVRHFIAFAFLHSLTASHVVVLFGIIRSTGIRWVGQGCLGPTLQQDLSPPRRRRDRRVPVE